MVPDSNPFRTTNDTNVLHGQNSKEQVFVGAIIPVFVIHIDEANGLTRVVDGSDGGSNDDGCC